MLKAEFFTRIDSALVFQKERFLDFLKLRILDSSYTKFANKIGLSINSDLLKNALLKGQAKVALNFPYKDCVLKGAQSKDSDKSDEIFFNEILASDEIDILFKPKALQNFKLISKGQETSDFELIKFALQNRRSIFDEKSGLCSHERGNKTKASIDEASGKLHDLSQKDKPSTPNLLIKGNNLLALHTLKARKDIYGQVKLIYIDPPYNTGNDSFNYNDRFNHSAWLVFMKNRLEIAREFLREDGVIFIQCDDNEQAYLKVLCDEIFGRENFVRQIIWRIGWVSGFKTTANIVRNHDTILMYAKNMDTLQINKIYNNKENYQERFNDENKRNIMQRMLDLNLSKEHADSLLEYICNIGMPEKYPLESTWNCSIYDKLNSIAIVSFSGEKISKMLKTTEFAGQKSEALLKRIIEISTKEGDLVMDFFAGSGTTCAVAHKMNRRWIGIEQMDYVEGITKERLIKVINGEQGGISKAVGWGNSSLTRPSRELEKSSIDRPQVLSQSDFSAQPTNLARDTRIAESNNKSESVKNEFIYAELMPLNALYKEKIAKSSNEGELAQIYDELQTKAFIDYRVDIQEMLKDRDFEALPLTDKKQILYAILDSNMDYVAYSDMGDLSFCVDKEVQELNRAFYEGGGNG